MRKTSLTNPLATGSEFSETFTSTKTWFQLAALIAFGITLWLWFGILFTDTPESAVYALDVGQGDSQLVVLTSDNDSVVTFLIDGGKDRAVLDELDSALGSFNKKYIDVVILTHPDLDHGGGLVEVIKRYDIGLFVSNGRKGESDALKALDAEITARNIRHLVLREGDAISYGDTVFSILSPDATLVQNESTNESGLVMMLESGGTNILFAADIGVSTENVLLRKYDLDADILKVGHHGSKNSSGENFIAEVSPAISVIGVGRNSYGHPTERVLDTLALAGSRMYRTDENGTVKILLDTLGVENEEIETEHEGLLATVASVFTGSYKNNSMTTVSLPQALEEGVESRLVPYSECSFQTSAKPAYSPVLLSEIAWMGSTGGATHEWIELYNPSGKVINLSGWQLINENERIHFKFPQGALFDKTFLVLARSSAEVNADFAFTGSIRNSKEGLRLFDNNCRLIDEVFASPNWPAGDNKTKQTMERSSDLSWMTSANIGETPDR